MLAYSGLSTQKMEDLLARLALAMQEYNLPITYHKRLDNANVDALSRKEHSDLEYTATTTQLSFLAKDLRQQQFTDPVIPQIHKALTQNKSTSPRWNTLNYAYTMV